MPLPDIRLTGTLTDNPELRYTGKGTPVCNFRLITFKLRKSGDGWKETDHTYVSVVAWDKQTVTLEDRHLKRRVFPLGPGFLLEGRPVVLVPPRRPRPSGPERTASGSVTSPGMISAPRDFRWARSADDRARARTVPPRAAARSATWLPTNPVAPVIK